MDSYAIIMVGGKQYRVREGDKLLVDRLSAEEGKTFHPNLLFVGGDGKADLKPKAQVTAKVVGHVLGEKVQIGKYKAKKGYQRHAGHRSRLTEIEIQSIGAKSAASTEKKTESKPKASTTTKKKAES